MNSLPFFSGGMGSIVSIFAIMVAVFVVLRLSGLAKSGQSIFQLGRAFRLAVEAPVKLAIRPLLWISFKIPGFEHAGKWLWSKMTDDSLEAFFDRAFRNSKSDLRRGELEAYAARRWPKDRFPHLWIENIPEDLKRPLVVDGRMIDGSAPAAVMAPNFVDTILVGQAFRRAVLAGLFWGFVGLVAWHPQTYLGKLTGGGIAQAGARSEQAGFEKRRPGSGVDLAYQSLGVQLQEDAWTMETMNNKIREQSELQGKVIENRRDAILASAPGGSITAILFGILVFFGTWRGLVRDAAQQRVEPLRRQMKESVVRWKYRLDQREVELKAYLAQLKTAMEWDKTELIEIGKAAGTFRYRGQLGAPAQGQQLRYTLQDMGQHTLILGGTGEGKTRSIIVPVVKQILAIRKQKMDAGESRAISIYGTDGKAVLWRDIKQAAIDVGQGDDVRVIGCRPDHGEYGVDLLDGVEPQLVADIIRSVARQTKGDQGGDSFWPDMASEVLRNCSVIARAAECTRWGLVMANSTNERLYSLVFIYQLALDPELQLQAIGAIQESYQDEIFLPALKEFITPELTYAIRYMASQWETMASDTKTGIIANITQIMAPFASNMALRSSFASGTGENVMSMAEAWGRISLVNVSSLEYGIAGRIVNVFLKTLLYTEARKREMADPSIGFREKVLFAADEFQDLITADIAGMSDANFWNVARSSGVIGFVSTQGMASLEQAIGRISAENFALQMRNKIILRVEDPATMEYAKKLAGKSLRSYTFESHRHESYDAMVRESGYDPMAAGPARIVELPDNYIGALASGWLQAHKASLPLSFDTWKAAVETDLRFVPSGGLFGGHDGHAQLAAEQSAYWRAEDKALAYMADGNHEADVLRDEDLISMGRAHAYVYLQRAGSTRQDLVEIG